MPTPPRCLSVLAAVAALIGLGAVGACCCDSKCIKPPPCCTPAPAEPAKAKASAAPVPAAQKAAVDAGNSAIHNLKRLSANLIRGAQPEGEAAFAELEAMGVQTILSDDGSRPDAESAERHHMRYVHVPIGYDGIPPEKMILMEKAFTALPGPFFVHCHHGKHRGPAACMVGRMLLDGISAEEAVAEMKEAGTDPKYKGLYAVPGHFFKATPEQLAAVSIPPSVAPIPGFQQSMVNLDQGWTRMQDVRKASWKTPEDHPDVDPPHEAVMLAEMLREIGRTPDVAGRPEAFRQHLASAEKAAWDMEAALKASPADLNGAAAAFDRAQASCTACHAAYRDNKPAR